MLIYKQQFCYMHIAVATRVLFLKLQTGSSASTCFYLHLQDKTSNTCFSHVLLTEDIARNI